MRVAVLHNAVPDNATLEDQDTLVQVETVVGALARLGHEPTTVPCTLDLETLRLQLHQARPDIAFNLVESLAEADSLAYLPPALLDVLNVPYAGSRTESLFLTTHKLLAKQRLRGAGLPTPDWIEGETIPEEREDRMRCPSSVTSCSSSNSSWILKGVWDQASRGMDDDAVLMNAEPSEVRRRVVERTRRLGRPCFAEQFIEGREFNLSVLAGVRGPEVLPPAEIDFSAFPPDKPRIVGHKAKWQADSFEFHHTPRRFDFAVSDRPLLEQLRHLAEACWRLFDLRGWVRVDFRVDREGRPWILEINANPCLSSDAGFAAALDRAGISLDAAVQRILKDSL